MSFAVQAQTPEETAAKIKAMREKALQGTIKFEISGKTYVNKASIIKASKGFYVVQTFNMGTGQDYIFLPFLKLLASTQTISTGKEDQGSCFVNGVLYKMVGKVTLVSIKGAISGSFSGSLYKSVKGVNKFETASSGAISGSFGNLQL